jgi:hypothetical protein
VRFGLLLTQCSPTFVKGRLKNVSIQNCTTEPACRCLAPGNLFEDGPEEQGITGELAAKSSRQLGSAEGMLTYATVVPGSPACKSQVGRTSSQPTVQLTLKPLPHFRQPLGACFFETCPDRCVACLMTPLRTPKWLQAVPPYR